MLGEICLPTIQGSVKDIPLDLEASTLKHLQTHSPQSYRPTYRQIKHQTRIAIFKALKKRSQ